MPLTNREFQQTKTPPTNFDLQSNNDKIGDAVLTVLGFFAVYYLLMLLERPFDAFISRLVTLRSEYTLTEQLSKYYLFVVVLASVFSYRVFNESAGIKLAISFLLFSTILYMSESNMITEKIQPFFGLIGISFTGFFLLRSRSWLSLSCFLFGFTLISLGALSDFEHDNDYIRSGLPTFILPFLQIASEERFEAMGIAFFCVSAILCFRAPLRHFASENTKGCLLILLASAGLTFGNGFLHYQYNPSGKLHLLALATTIMSFLGLMLFNKRICKSDALLTLVTENLFYAFIFLFFVLLPSIHGRARTSTALLLWFPLLILTAVYLWRRHPTHRAAGRAK